MRDKKVAGFAPVVVTVITHLPNVTEAYHEKRFEVIQACLETMRAGAKCNHTFVVWDNGSMPTFCGWVQHDFKPDVFIQSPNIGKTSAQAYLARMFPPETILTFSDDDMFFYDNWLEPQIELLEHFPNVAAVTGYPVRTSFRWGNDNTLAWAKRHAKLEVGRFIPPEWEDDFARSLGREIIWHRNYTAADVDFRITSNKGVQAYSTSHHCQFIGYAGRVAQACNFENFAMAEERSFDIRLDEIGLRLATTQRLVRHIGNVLDDKIRSELWQLQALPH